jgi:flagellar basal body-associated protein FliL
MQSVTSLAYVWIAIIVVVFLVVGVVVLAFSYHSLNTRLKRLEGKSHRNEPDNRI